MRKLCTMNMCSGTAPGVQGFSCVTREFCVTGDCYNAECTGTFSKQNKKEKAKPFAISGGL